MRPGYERPGFHHYRVNPPAGGNHTSSLQVTHLAFISENLRGTHEPPAALPSTAAAAAAAAEEALRRKDRGLRLPRHRRSVRGLDIGYGSDSDTRKGTFDDGRFEATLTLDKKAMYYNVNAQLQGSGDINCSVTVDGKTKKGHASGGYNICDAQLSSDFTGGWS